MKKGSFHPAATFSHIMCYILSALALLLGGIIYVVFRTSEYTFESWIQALNFHKWSGSARINVFVQRLFLPEWFVFSLPHGLWAFAYAIVITGIWTGSRSRLRYFWFASIPILVLGIEILQIPGFLPGIFCFQDIGLGITGLVLGMIIGFKIKKKSIFHEKTVT